MGGDISILNRPYYDEKHDVPDVGVYRQGTSLDHRSLPPELRAIGRCRKSMILRQSAVLLLRHLRACPRRCVDHVRCGQKCLVLDQELYSSVPAFSIHACCECLNPMVATRSELERKRKLLSGPPLPVSLHEIQGYLRECVRYFSCCNELIVIATVYACRFAENVCMRPWNWRIIVAISVFLACKVWEDYCLFLSNLQDCFIYLSKCGLIQLGAYGGGPPLYRLRKLEAFALADILQWNVNIQSSEYCEFYFSLQQNNMASSGGGSHSARLQRLSTTPDSILLTSSGELFAASNGGGGRRGDHSVSMGSFRENPLNGRPRSSLTASRGKSEHVSPVSFQSLILQRRNSRSTAPARHRRVKPDVYPQHACAESIGCAGRLSRESRVSAWHPVLLDGIAAELRQRSLDRGNPFVGNWAHSPPAEPRRSLRVLSAVDGMESQPGERIQSLSRRGAYDRIP
ncbi:hypothetical protein Pmar_PMAR002458 [Perkinsus marinus ATCC 50983]|uniref:Uncharacterized protein n=1 Tax=Perkinsus marinus (strain ATCC 50983 / TXsc) TaxID=423536 RepID=C5KS70_PERM5|nr:hypothetical protein Pmar_PMAR002458 [Perkinsus marinus ATCC 50983]EER12651.1 hypothetical protein Pmar_PMAR002458 [Perkinsus marinus ATCC 50983]|eukprot:XP_002780856.1 hypothetical protein Pmar_PMAR002458 [Perkinsus marinus ATCC 50983]